MGYIELDTGVLHMEAKDKEILIKLDTTDSTRFEVNGVSVKKETVLNGKIMTAA